MSLRPPALLLLACTGLSGCLLGGSTVSAQPYDEDNACWLPSQDVGSTSADGCDDVLTLATDPDGACWLLPDSCLPDSDGWVEGCPVSFAEVDDPACDDT